MTKWEYKIVTLWENPEATLNAAGADGWELVGVMPRGRENYPSGYLKRAIASTTTTTPVPTTTPAPTPAPGITIKL